MHHLDTIISNAVQSLAWPVDALIRILLAALCGGVVGLEREIRGRQAGFRTNLLVGVGAAVAMIVSTRFGLYPWPAHENYNITVDPARIAYGVMVGIGFLGAGAIIKTESEIHGLTTAAALWCVTAIGLAAGFGLYLFVVCATLIVLAALWGLAYVERVLPRLQHRRITLRRSWDPGCVEETVRRLDAAEVSVVSWTFERSDDLRTVDIDVHIAYRGDVHFDRLAERLSDTAGYEVVAVRGP